MTRAKKELVSVIIPTKNSAEFLGQCLDSIKNQTYQNIEIIVVDNSSSDQTPHIARRYTDKFYIKGPERCAQRNYGVLKSSGKFVIIIDSDMKLSPTVIDECIVAGSVGVVGVVIPEESFGDGFWAQCKKLERSYYVGISYMEAARFFPKEVFEKVGGYDETMISGEDWDLSQRIENLGKLTRISSFIYHNEGHISLFKSIRKKYYYAKKFSKYTGKNPKNEKVARQTSIVSRYMLFFAQPKKLFRNPLVGLGMLLMKTCEFGCGALGYIAGKLG